MTPVDQNVLHGDGKHGDCLSATLGSMIGVPTHAVPHFADPEKFSDGPDHDAEAYVNAGAPLNWWTAVNVWLLMMGFRLWDVDPTDPAWCGDDEFLLVSGLSPRSPSASGEPVYHSVIYGRQPDGTYALAHDPHPSRSGIVGEPRHYRAVRDAAWEVPA